MKTPKRSMDERMNRCQYVQSFGVAITPTDITKVIANEDDFGHEMRVGRVLRGYLSSETLQGGTYSDPVTNKARQFDFRWLFRKEHTVLNLAVECKNVRSEAPIIISGRKRSAREAFHDLVESRKGGRFQSPRGPEFFDVPSIGVVRGIGGNNSIYPPDGFVGKSLLQIRPDVDKTKKGNYVRVKDSEIYDKWSQALASAVDLVRDARRYAFRFDLLHVFSILLPAVVVPDDVLWQIEYDINGRPVGDPVKTDECEFYVAREAAPPGDLGDSTEPYTFSHLHFLTMTGFGLFLLKITGDEDWRKLAFDEKTISAARAERA